MLENAAWHLQDSCSIKQIVPIQRRLSRTARPSVQILVVAAKHGPASQVESASGHINILRLDPNPLYAQPSRPFHNTVKQHLAVASPPQLPRDGKIVQSDH